jgi:predicted dinucleotide-binding enzyme
MTDAVGIVGAGRLGQAMARTARAGRRVVVANSRGPQSLASVVSAIGDGVSAGTVDEAASAGIVVLAVPWTAYPRPCKASTGTVRSSSTRPTTEAPTISKGERRASSSPTSSPAHVVVKAGNTLGADVLGSDPHEAGGDRVMFVSGDDADAKAHVVALFQDAGFAAIDLGDLATGGAMQEIHHPLAGVNLIRLQGA